MQIDDQKMFKSSPFDDQELEMLREKFVVEYARKKGWDSNRLSTSQMFEITSQKEFKTPGMILG